MTAWLELCQSKNIGNSPISITLYKEQLDNFELNVDGSKISNKFGFKYIYKQINIQDFNLIL
jgi:hypothetical protein